MQSTGKTLHKELDTAKDELRKEQELAKTIEKAKSDSLAKGTVTGTMQSMGAATKGGKYHRAGSNDSNW